MEAPGIFSCFLPFLVLMVFGQMYPNVQTAIKWNKPENKKRTCFRLQEIIKSGS